MVGWRKSLRLPWIHWYMKIMVRVDEEGACKTP